MNHFSDVKVAHPDLVISFYAKLIKKYFTSVSTFIRPSASTPGFWRSERPVLEFRFAHGAK